MFFSYQTTFLTLLLWCSARRKDSHNHRPDVSAKRVQKIDEGGSRRVAWFPAADACLAGDWSLSPFSSPHPVRLGLFSFFLLVTWAFLRPDGGHVDPNGLEAIIAKPRE